MKKIITLSSFALFVVIFGTENRLFAQNQYSDGPTTLKITTQQLWRNTYGDAGFGASEDSYHIQVRDNSDLDGQGFVPSSNVGDGDNGWCFQGGQNGGYPMTISPNRLMLNYTYTTNAPMYYDVYYDTWEDDRGDRCEYTCCNAFLDDDDDRCGPGTIPQLPIRSLGAPCADNNSGWIYFCGSTNAESTAAKFIVNYSTPKPQTSLTTNSCDFTLSSSINGAGSYSGCTINWERQGDGIVGAGQNYTTSVPGNYRAVYNCNGCDNQSDWLLVSVPGSAPNAGMINSSQTICTNTAPATITSSTNPSGTGTLSYQWQKSTTDCSTDWVDISGATGLTYTPPTLSQTTYYRRVTTDCWGRTSYTSCVTITVKPLNNPGAISGTATVCTGSTVTLSNGVTGGTWSSANTSVATVDNAGVVTGVADGQDTIYYTVSDGVCPDSSAALPITVSASPNAGTISGITTACPSGTILYTSDGDANGVWNSSDVTIAAVNPSTGVIVPLSVGTVTITYTVNYGSCGSDVASQQLNLVDNDAPVITSCMTDQTLYLGANGCSIALPNYGTNTAFTVTDNCGNQTDGSLTITQTPSAGTSLTVGTHQVKLTVTDNGNNTTDCLFNVIVKDTIAPNIQVNVPATVSCDGEPTNWTTNITDNCTSSSDITVTSDHQSGEILPSGVTTVHYTATDANGNTSQFAFDIVVSSLPQKPIIEPDTSTVCIGSDLELLITNPTNGVSYTWYFNNGQIATGVNYTAPNADINDAGTYTVIAKNNGNDCQTTTSALVSAEACEISIPKIFTPNGDGKNDVFEIKNLETYPNSSISIFNRWGAKVFMSSDYQNDWDGHSQNALNVGKDELPEGTYYYILKVGGASGQPNAGKLYTGYIYLKR